MRPEIVLDEGDYQWWVRTWSPAGYGPWSAPLAFHVTAAAGFNSTFDGNAIGWEANRGAWFVEGGRWYSTTGGSASASRSFNYGNFTYEVRHADLNAPVEKISELDFGEPIDTAICGFRGKGDEKLKFSAVTYSGHDGRDGESDLREIDRSFHGLPTPTA